MRKLFVLFLLVSLVPFTVGCNGLWDFDDDDDTALRAATTVKVTPKVALPATVAASMRAAAQDAWSIPMSYGGQNYLPVDVSSDGTTTTLTYPEIDVSAVTFTSNKATLSIVLTIAGQQVTVPVEVSNLSTTDTASVVPTITIDVNPTTGVITYSAPGMTTPTDTTVVPANEQYIVSVKYNGAAVSTSATTPTNVNSFTPTFAVEFNQAITANDVTSWQVYVKNLTTNVEFTLDNSANASLFNVSYVNNVAYVEVVGGTISGLQRALKASMNYQIELKAATVSTNSLVGAPRYIQTPAAEVAATTLTDYTGKTANIDVANPQVITLTFSGNVTNEPVGTVTLERYATSDRTGTPEASITIDATSATYAFNGTTVTVTFAQPFMSGKFYRVKNSTGLWLDANGEPITNVTQIDFATN